MILDTCARTAGLLFLLCDVSTSCDVKQEERAYFLSLLCLAILHLLADFQWVMISDYLQTLDTDDVVIMDVFGLSKKFAHVIEELKTPLFDQFLNGLQENKFGNIQY